MSLPNSYAVEDDEGVWIVAPREYGVGKHSSAEVAQNEANRRNYEDGIAEKDGTLKAELTAMEEGRWRNVHLRRPSCTCTKAKGISPGRAGR